MSTTTGNPRSLLPKPPTVDPLPIPILGASNITVDTIINSDGAIAVILRNWVPEDYAFNLHTRLMAEVPWIYGQMNLYGKTVNIPRGMFFLGDPDVIIYRYSRLSYPVIPWNTGNNLYAEIEHIRNAISEDPNIQYMTGNVLHYNSCLLNQYISGADTITYHSDKEALGPSNAVVAISLGATRMFVFKSINKGPDGKFTTIKTYVNNGDLLLMAGTCQQLWTHGLPSDPSLGGSRISLTYRLI